MRTNQSKKKLIKNLEMKVNFNIFVSMKYLIFISQVLLILAFVFIIGLHMYFMTKQVETFSSFLTNMLLFACMVSSAAFLIISLSKYRKEL